MQRMFLFRLKGKATASASDRDYGFKCGNQFSRKPVESSFSCVLGNKTPVGKYGSQVKKNEALVGSGNGKEWSNKLGSMKTNPPLLRFVSKKRGWKNLMWEKLRSKTEICNDVVTGLGEVRRKASLRHLVRIPSKILVSGLKLKIRRSKKERDKFENDGNEEREVWKRRILMGVRCRPLSSPVDALFLPRAPGHP